MKMLHTISTLKSFVSHDDRIKRRPYRAIPRIKLLAISVAVTFHSGFAAAELPVPSSTFINAGQGAGSYKINGTNLTVNQQSDRAIFNWDQFNVGVDNTVTFNQPSHSSIALNRIHDGNPSQILGSLTANGQVYLYNQNGIIFGEGSKVNVGSLVATTLNIDDDRFMNGTLLSAIEDNEAAFFDVSGNNSGKIAIKSRAEINADNRDGGQVFIIASEVVNEGSIHTSEDGQTILAASTDSVYLAGSDNDPDLRGVLVEVETGGTVTNLGEIVAEQGNISLIGLAVNQSGRLRATTSVKRNGSVRLMARDNAVVRLTDDVDDVLSDYVGIDGVPTTEKIAVATRTGSVVLGEGSSIEIAPDANDLSMVTDGEAQLKSRVDIMGKDILLQEGAEIVAASGEVNIVATTSPGVPASSVLDDSYVYMDTGSVIDVSGTDTTVLEMARNSLAVEARSNELADSPLQRDGVLNGQVLYVDLRKGTDIVDYSGALSNVEKSLSERMSEGGTINIASNGDFVQRDGALLDVSGGQVSYESGYIKESKLISDFRIYNLSDADKNRTYDAVLGAGQRDHDRWATTQYFESSSNADKGSYVEGFIEGKAAGNINISASNVLLSADGVKADTVIGPYQREISRLPEKSALNVDLRYKTDSLQTVSFLAESLVDPITDEIAKAPDSAMQRDALTADLVLPDNYIERSGLGTLRVATNGEVIIGPDAVISADPGASIELTGSHVMMDGNIVIDSGSVTIAAAAPTGNVALAADVVIGEGALIDTSGGWINESLLVGGPDYSVPLLYDGGDIQVTAKGDITLEAGSLLDASGGAMIDIDGDIRDGAGGDISVLGTLEGGSTVILDGDVQSYALNQGGDFSLTTSSIAITDDNGHVLSQKQTVISSAFFQDGGFGSYEFTATSGDLLIDTIVQPIVKNYILNDSNTGLINKSAAIEKSVYLVDSTSSFDELTSIGVLPDYQRQSADLAFTLSQDSSYDENILLVVTQDGAVIADTGGDITLSSDTSIHVYGDIEGVGSDITLNNTKYAQETGFFDNQAIWLADGSTIRSASGVTLEPNEQGLRLGEVVDAGTVTINASRGYVILEQGSEIDVSADSVELDQIQLVSGFGPAYEEVSVAPKAGTIVLSSPEAIIMDGGLYAGKAAAAGASGGVLDVRFDASSRLVDTSQLGAGGKEHFIYTARDIVIRDDSSNVLPDDVSVGDIITASLNGITEISTSRLQQAGFDTVKLKTNLISQNGVQDVSEIRFDSDAQIEVANSLVLDTRILNANDHSVDLSAAYIRVGATSVGRNTLTTSPVQGNGSVDIEAALKIGRASCRERV